MSTKKKKNISKKQLINTRDDSYLSGLFIILTGIVTFLVRAQVSSFTAPKIIEPILNTGWHSQMFVYYKWIFVIGLALAALVILIDKMLTGHYQVQASYINMPLLILVILVLLSSCTADYKTIALTGVYDQWDGALIFLAYLALCFAAANTVLKPWFKLGINAALTLITIANTVIIMCHFLGMDLLQYQVVKTLIAPADFRSHMSGELWSTLGQQNYISGMAAALFAYFMAGSLLESKWASRLGCMLLTLAAFAIILASLSSSGFVSVLIVSPLIIAVIFLSRNKKRTLLSAGVLLLLCLGVFTAMDTYNPAVGDQTTSLLKQSLHLSRNISPAAASEWNKIMPLTVLPAAAAEQPDASADSFDLPVPGWGAGTGRVYIWGKTIELIQARPVLGYGLGTLAYYFPQNDIDNIAYMLSYDQLVSKAHNMYLDIAYGSGLPALLALLALFFLHFRHTWRRLWQAERDDSLAFRTALFLFFCTFAIQWLFNDMLADSSAVFWILLGAGVSLNKEQDQP